MSGPWSPARQSWTNDPIEGLDLLPGHLITAIERVSRKEKDVSDSRFFVGPDQALGAALWLSEQTESITDLISQGIRDA